MWGRLGGVVVLALAAASCARAAARPARGAARRTSPARLGAAALDATATQFAALQAATRPSRTTPSGFASGRGAGRRPGGGLAAAERARRAPADRSGRARRRSPSGFSSRTPIPSTSARGWLELARSANRAERRALDARHAGAGGGRRRRATAERALVLADDVRRARPWALTARRARRLEERIRRTRPDLPGRRAPSTRRSCALREGDRRRHAALADDGGRRATPAHRCARARSGCAPSAERAAGDRAAPTRPASSSHARRPHDPLAPRALATAAALALERGRRRWRVRALSRGDASLSDEPAGARGVLRASRRIQQESAASTRRRSPPTSSWRAAIRARRVADDARWRAAWVRYLAGEYAAAERAVRRARRRAAAATCAIAARVLARRGRSSVSADDDAARARYARVAEEHDDVVLRRAWPRTRLGRSPSRPATRCTVAPRRRSRPGSRGPHAERARALQTLGLLRLARREVDALRDAGAPPSSSLERIRGHRRARVPRSASRGVGPSPDDVNADALPARLLGPRAAGGAQPRPRSALRGGADPPGEPVRSRGRLARQRARPHAAPAVAPRGGSPRRSGRRRRRARRRSTIRRSTSSSAPRSSRACSTSTAARA